MFRRIYVITIKTHFVHTSNVRYVIAVDLDRSSDVTRLIRTGRGAWTEMYVGLDVDETGHSQIDDQRLVRNQTPSASARVVPQHRRRNDDNGHSDAAAAAAAAAAAVIVPVSASACSRRRISAAQTDVNSRRGDAGRSDNGSTESIRPLQTVS